MLLPRLSMEDAEFRKSDSTSVLRRQRSMFEQPKSRNRAIHRSTATT